MNCLIWITSLGNVLKRQIATLEACKRSTLNMVLGLFLLVLFLKKPKFLLGWRVSNCSSWRNRALPLVTGPAKQGGGDPTQDSHRGKLTNLDCSTNSSRKWKALAKKRQWKTMTRYYRGKRKILGNNIEVLTFGKC